MDLYKNTETNELVRLCHEHNDDAFDELVSRYTPMMHKVISGFLNTPYDQSELFCEACVALHVAAQKFDLSQTEVTFGLFARICVRNRMVDLHRTAEAGRAVADCDIDDVAVEDSVENRIVERETFKDILKVARNLLSDYEYRVLLFHIGGYKTAAIAKALGRTPKSVDNAKSRLFRNLRMHIGDIFEF